MNTDNASELHSDSEPCYPAALLKHTTKQEMIEWITSYLEELFHKNRTLRQKVMKLESELRAAEASEIRMGQDALEEYEKNDVLISNLKVQLSLHREGNQRLYNAYQHDIQTECEKNDALIGELKLQLSLQRSVTQHLEHDHTEQNQVIQNLRNMIRDLEIANKEILTIEIVKRKVVEDIIIPVPECYATMTPINARGRDKVMSAKFTRNGTMINTELIEEVRVEVENSSDQQLEDRGTKRAREMVNLALSDVQAAVPATPEKKVKTVLNKLVDNIEKAVPTTPKNRSTKQIAQKRGTFAPEKGFEFRGRLRHFPCGMCTSDYICLYNIKSKQPHWKCIVCDTRGMWHGSTK
jgi:hypothetical protein